MNRFMTQEQAQMVIFGLDVITFALGYIAVMLTAIYCKKS
jgi:hypothetical protein